MTNLDLHEKQTNIPSKLAERIRADILVGAYAFWRMASPDESSGNLSRPRFQIRRALNDPALKGN
tara:strand:- start:6451 stop:6645 length:195 start_codon:yes stop_codon:yes gene_type:complete